MKTIDVKLYKINELSEESKKIAIEREKKEEKEFYIDTYLEEDLTEYAKELLQENFKNAELKDIMYDLSYSQGSGAMIEFSWTIEDLNKKYKKLTPKELEKISDTGYTEIKINHQGWYYHERSFDVDYQDFTYYDDELEKIQEKTDKMIESFKEDVINMNEQLKKEGYSIIESEETDEETEKRLIDEKYYFYSDGSFYGAY